MRTSGHDLRKRKGQSSKVPSPRLFYEETPVPAAKLKWNACENSSHEGSNDSYSDEGDSVPVSQIETTGIAMSGEQVKREESKLKKIVIRVVFGAGMFCIFAGSVSNHEQYHLTPKPRGQYKKGFVTYMLHPLLTLDSLRNRSTLAMSGYAYW